MCNFSTVQCSGINESMTKKLHIKFHLSGITAHVHVRSRCVHVFVCICSRPHTVMHYENAYYKPFLCVTFLYVMWTDMLMYDRQPKTLYFHLFLFSDLYDAAKCTYEYIFRATQ